MRKRILWMLLLVAFLLVACNAVRENPAATAGPAPAESGQPFVTIASYGYYTDGEFLPNELQQSLDAFGDLMWLEPSFQTKTYTQIPEPENNAKGVDPVFIVMPSGRIWVLSPGSFIIPSSNMRPLLIACLRIQRGTWYSAQQRC